MTRKKISVLFVVFTVLFNLFPASFAKANYFEPASINSVDRTDVKKPIIRGITNTNTEVLIYKNLQYVDTAEIVGETEGKWKFEFQPDEDLSEGEHVYQALARDKTSLRLSIFSNSATIKVPEKKLDTALPAPTLIEPNKNTVTADLVPLIKGLTVNDTKVNIYIDGVLNGGTAFLEHDSGTANFAYKPFLNLGVGHHTAWAVAIDRHGRTSRSSNVLSFKIEEPLPAPILIDSIETGEQQLITGLVKNDLLIRIYKEHKLLDEIEVMAHPSGTANFSYTVDTSDGKGLLYATAVDDRGKESHWSNIIALSAKAPRISDEGVEEDAIEEVEVLSADNAEFERIKELLVMARLFTQNKNLDLDDLDLEYLKNIIQRKDEIKLTDEEHEALQKLLEEKQKQSSPQESDEKTDEGKVSSEIDDILNRDVEEEGDDTGVINESKENQGKLRLNLIIFIVFLAAVIAWIFWVNRELIKERREQNEKDEEQNKN